MQLKINTLGESNVRSRCLAMQFNDTSSTYPKESLKRKSEEKRFILEPGEITLD